MKKKRTLKELLLFIFHFVHYLPHLILFYLHKNKPIIEADMIHAELTMERKDRLKQPYLILSLLSSSRHFRNLFYYRTRPYSTFLNILYPQISSLHIHTKQIGEGLCIIHGQSTEIGAESIGKNCVIFHQVTIGGTSLGAPVILDNVTIYAGAVIVGKITIGNNVVIGANATVTQDIPDNSTVYAPTPRVMRWSRNNLKESNNNHK